tara:strand:+ start:339 stop:1493 length:1155 start_codon:yes stop_codon:yes gene_type:complete
MYKSVKYFKGLNALRFFAAYMVLLHHAEAIRLNYKLFNLKQYSLFNNGGLAVSFFFVLSGFLITYLLLKEKTQTSNISVRKFYIRRILRIWPLYYFLVFIGTVILPVILYYLNSPVEVPYSFGEVILYYVFFAPFVVNIFYGHHLLEPLWSIGVEEIFYIIWAPLFKFLRQNALVIIISVIIIKVVLMTVMIIFFSDSVLYQILRWLQFEAMAVGGLGAYFLYHSNKDISARVIFNKPIQILLFFFIILRLTAFKYLIDVSGIFDFIFTAPVLSQLLMNFVFLWLIVNISINRLNLLKLNNRLFDFLGDISYGIYMYHMVIIFVVILFGAKMFVSLNSYFSTLLFYTIITLLSIAVAWVSKKYFEDRFLRMKSKFQSLDKSNNK